MCLPPFTELPWDEPTPECKEYKDWLEKKIQLSPWKKVDMLALGLSLFIQFSCRVAIYPVLCQIIWFLSTLYPSFGFTPCWILTVPHCKKSNVIQLATICNTFSLEGLKNISGTKYAHGQISDVFVFSDSILKFKISTSNLCDILEDWVH